MTLTLSADSLRPVASLFRRLRVKSTLPILDHVRITVAPDQTEAVLETTNLDIHLSVRLPIAGPTTPGSFTITRAGFFTIARLSDKGSAIRFDAREPAEDAADYQVTVLFVSRKMRTDHTLTGLLPSEFPPAPEISEKPVIFPSATLDAIRRIRPATSNDETRYVLNGLLLTPGHGGAVVATDGRRMATSTARIPCAEGILPNPVADLLVDPACHSAALWRGDGDRASLTFQKTMISFRLIDGNFPNYRQVIPTGFNSTCTFPTASVASIIAWLKPHKAETVKLAFGPNTVRFTIDDNLTSAATTVAALVTGEPPAAIAFNTSFLVDALAMGLNSIDMIDEMSPGVLTDGITRYVLMPQRFAAPAADPEPTDETEPDPTEETEPEPAES